MTCAPVTWCLPLRKIAAKCSRSVTPSIACSVLVASSPSDTVDSARRKGRRDWTSRTSYMGIFWRVGLRFVASIRHLPKWLRAGFFRLVRQRRDAATLPAMTGRIPRGVPLAGYGESKARKPADGARQGDGKGRKLAGRGALGRYARTSRKNPA